MPIRELTIERRLVGTVGQTETFHCHYVVRTSEETEAKAADFTILQVVTAAAGSPSALVFQNVSNAVRLFGRTLAGTDGTHDEHTKFTTAGASYNIQYRDIPPVGDATPPQFYSLAEVIAADGSPSQADFDAVTAALIAFGDAAASYP